MLGSLGLYERTEVRARARVPHAIQNPLDAQAYRRAIGSPRRGIGAATVTKLVAGCEHHRGDLIAASARAGELEGLRQAARMRLVESGVVLEQVRAGQLAAGRSIGHVVIATVTLPGGLVRHDQHQRAPHPAPHRRRDAERVLDDLRSLCRAAQVHDEHDGGDAHRLSQQAAGLHAQEVDAASDRRITVSTIHRAKGCEAQAVALLGCEEELLPSWRSVSSPDPQRLAEERLSFDVAATRQGPAAHHPRYRTARPGARRGGPSRFLNEAGLQHTPTSLAA